MKTITMTDEYWAWFKEAIAEMKRLYALPDEGIVHEYQDADDIARDVAEVLGDLIEKQGEATLHGKYFDFERYMNYSKWDALPAEYGDGILYSDGLRAVSAFIEFCETGKVTDDDGKELGA